MPLLAYLRSLQPIEPAELNEAKLAGNAKVGSRLFQSICSACHGRNGAGYQETANGTGIRRKAFLASVTDGFLRYLVKHGKDQTMMRPFGGKSRVAVANLTDAQIEDVLTFMRHNAW